MNSKYSNDPCTVPPEGWYCTRKKGHQPPCAALPVRANYVHVIEGSERCLNGHRITKKNTDGSPWNCVEPTCKYFANPLDTIFDKPAGDKAFYLRREIEPKIAALLEQTRINAMHPSTSKGYLMGYKAGMRQFSNQAEKGLTKLLEQARRDGYKSGYAQAVADYEVRIGAEGSDLQDTDSDKQTEVTSEAHPKETP